jgi:ABC-type glycerol-3-phosphate transport system permease component
MNAAPHSESLLSRFQTQLAEGEASDRNFGLVVGSIFLLIGFIPLIHRGSVRPWSVVVGAILILIGTAYPVALRWPKRAWLFLGFLIGLIVNPIVLAILFFFVVTPMGILMRAFGHDPLWRRKPTKLQSYWRTRSEPISNMSEQF